jgi:hypothetical protein
VEAAGWTAADGWEDPSYLSDASGDRLAPRIAVAPDGQATAIWQRPTASINELRFASRTGPGEDWEAAASVPGAAYVRSSDVAVDGLGGVIAVWDSRRDFSSSLFASRRVPGGAWSPEPEDVPAWGVWPSSPRVALDGDGDATVAWRLGDAGWPIVEAVVQRDGNWRQSTVLSRPGERGEYPAVAVDPSGAAPTVTWLGAGGVDVSVYDWSAPASFRPPVWSAPPRRVRPRGSLPTPLGGGSLTLTAPRQGLGGAVRGGALRAVCWFGAIGRCDVSADLAPKVAKRLRIPGRRVGSRVVVARGSVAVLRPGSATFVRLRLAPGARRALRRIHRVRSATRRRAIARARTPFAKRRARRMTRPAIPIRLHATARFYSQTRTARTGLRLR